MMARAAPKRLAALLAARGGGAGAFPTARAMEIGAQAAGRRTERQRKGRSSRSRSSLIERTRCARSGNQAGIRPHRHARARHQYPHVALGSAQLLVWLVCQRVRGGGNVNLRRARCLLLCAKTRLHRWLVPILGALQRFWRRGAAAQRPFRRLAQWKSVRKRQGGAQGAEGRAEALDLGMGLDLGKESVLREREARAAAIQLAFGRTATPGHAKDTHM